MVEFEKAQKRKLHNELEKLKGRTRVYLRVKPNDSPSEVNCVKALDDYRIMHNDSEYQFDSLFGPTVS